MSRRFAQLAFSPAVRRHQHEHGSDRAYGRMLEGPAAADPIGPAEAEFIAERDSFYLATVGENGWPYIQHRGGPAGFLKVLGEHTLGFADLRGNRQYITRGNLDHDDRVSLFLMDYAHRTRLKILGRARAVEDDPGLLAALTAEGSPGRPERALIVDVEGFDWNCPQHIPQLFPRDAVEQALGTLRTRVEELERENARLRAAG
ncbi:pyridoxamine 5'-phosphate oxidase family protein [Actinocorallia longicatena]|uniref:Pyridoxamine 5'-phosphate oxidase family protein n=1 Tax=Actinocorallia longicatena TaxID=111803 RepID=A0ABP6PYX7_9ACTN